MTFIAPIFIESVYQIVGNVFFNMEAHFLNFNMKRDYFCRGRGKEKKRRKKVIFIDFGLVFFFIL
jgi:hypothetical protein